MADTCNRRAGSDIWHPRACGRPVKDEGMCAQHLAGKRRREKADAARNDKYRDEREKRQRASAIIGADVFYSDGRYTLSDAVMGIVLERLESGR